MKKELRAYIEAELRDYKRTRAELEELRDNLLNLSPGPPDGMPRGTATSDPTFQRTARLMTNRHIRYMETVLYGISMALEEFDEEKLQLVELKYWQRPRQLTDVGIAIKLDVSKRTIYRWTEEICEAIGKELGWVDELKCHKNGTFGG